MKAMLSPILSMAISISTMAAETPTWDNLEKLLGQPIKSEAVMNFVKAYSLKPIHEFNMPAYIGADYKLPFALYYNANRISGIIIVISRPTGQKGSVYSGKLPFGLLRTDTAKSVIKRIGKPTSPPEDDFLYYKTRGLHIRFKRDSHMLADIYLETK